MEDTMAYLESPFLLHRAMGAPLAPGAGVCVEVSIELFKFAGIGAPVLDQYLNVPPLGVGLWDR